MNDLFEYCKTNWLELVSVVFALISVWLAAKEKIGLYPTGLIAVIIAIYIYLNEKLYADVGVQAYYIVASIYGWWNWTKLNQSNNSVSKLNSIKEWVVYSVITVIIFVAFYVLLLQTDTDVPFIDSLVNAIFVTGMILMANKKIENWLFWIIGDVGSVFISWYKHLYFYAVQYMIFTLLACYAYYLWSQKMKHERIA